MRHFKWLIIAVILSMTISFTGCADEHDAEETLPIEDAAAETEGGTGEVTEAAAEDTSRIPNISTESGSEPVSSDVTSDSAAHELHDPEGFWEDYCGARAITDSLSRRETRVMVYTRQGEVTSQNEQSVSMHICAVDMDVRSPKLSASGSVKAAGRVIPMEVYYTDGLLYRASGDTHTKVEATFADAWSSVDIMEPFQKELTRDTITAIDGERSLDGTEIITLEFEGMFNGMKTVGTGEIVINAGGLVISQGFNMETIPVDGLVRSIVHQSVEYQLIAWNDEVSSIVFPDLSVY